jgi:hypothetical protein
MKQPKVKLVIERGLAELDDVWIDINSVWEGYDAGWRTSSEAQLGISVAKKEATAWKFAAEKLERLAKECRKNMKKAELIRK